MLRAITIIGITFLLLAPYQASAATPDHVCLPSVTQEDAAWTRLTHEISSADEELSSFRTPLMEKYKAEEKLIITSLLSRRKELDDRYKSLTRLTHSLNKGVEFPCTYAQAHSSELDKACQDLRNTYGLIRAAKDGHCGKVEIEPPFIYVGPTAECANEAKEKYRAAIHVAKDKYQTRKATAYTRYNIEMMPACTFWQRITFQSLDRLMLRKREECVAANLSPAQVTKCMHK